MANTRTIALDYWAAHPALNAAQVAEWLESQGLSAKPGTLRQWKRRHSEIAAPEKPAPQPKAPKESKPKKPKPAPKRKAKSAALVMLPPPAHHTAPPSDVPDEDAPDEVALLFTMLRRGIGPRRMREPQQQVPQCKFTAGAQERILEQIEMAVPQATAAAYAGISSGTFYKWVARGREAARLFAESAAAGTVSSEPRKDEDFRLFYEELQISQAMAETVMVLRLQHHGHDDPKVIQWMLERRFSERWKQRTEVDQRVSAVVAGAPLPLLKELHDMTPKQLEALAGIDLDGMGLPTDGYPGGESEADTDTGEE